jgi:hypothetical protein
MKNGLLFHERGPIGPVTPAFDGRQLLDYMPCLLISHGGELVSFECFDCFPANEVFRPGLFLELRRVRIYWEMIAELR